MMKKPPFMMKSAAKPGKAKAKAPFKACSGCKNPKGCAAAGKCMAK